MAKIIRQMFGRQKETECSRYVRVAIGGEQVLLTPSQAKRYEELSQTGKYRKRTG